MYEWSLQWKFVLIGRLLSTNGVGWFVLSFRVTEVLLNCYSKRETLEFHQEQHGASTARETSAAFKIYRPCKVWKCWQLHGRLWHKVEIFTVWIMPPIITYKRQLKTANKKLQWNNTLVIQLAILGGFSPTTQEVEKFVKFHCYQLICRKHFTKISCTKTSTDLKQILLLYS